MGQGGCGGLLREQQAGKILGSSRWGAALGLAMAVAANMAIATRERKFGNCIVAFLAAGQGDTVREELLRR